MKFLQKHARCWRIAMALAAAGLLSSGSAGAATLTRDLTPFFVNYFVPVPMELSPPRYPQLYDGIPEIWAGTGYNNVTGLPKRTVASGSTTVVAAPGFESAVDSDKWPLVGKEAVPRSILQRIYRGTQGGPCERYVFLPTKIYGGQSMTYSQILGGAGDPTVDGCNNAGVPGGTLTDTLTFGGPIRRSTLDGFEYEAASMRVQRKGVPWATYYFGYRMGSTAGSSNWQDSNRSLFAANFPKFPNSSEDYELVTLPPPFVEGEVIEFVNAKVSPASPGGHYFYATSDADKNLLDGDENWIRTGRNFKSGGYLPVCRFFYLAAGAAAGTHFFTARADECETFKQMAGFTYEGTPFRASLPKVASAGVTDAQRCPAGTLPLYRFFNHAPAGTYQPNHRYITNRLSGSATSGTLSIDLAALWTDEGLALCVPK